MGDSSPGLKKEDTFDQRRGYARPDNRDRRAVKVGEEVRGKKPCQKLSWVNGRSERHNRRQHKFVREETVRYRRCPKIVMERITLTGVNTLKAALLSAGKSLQPAPPVKDRLYSWIKRSNLDIVWDWSGVHFIVIVGKEIVLDNSTSGQNCNPLPCVVIGKSNKGSLGTP